MITLRFHFITFSTKLGVGTQIESGGSLYHHQDSTAFCHGNIAIACQAGNTGGVETLTEDA
jgi:hypothetical protein